MKKWFDFDSNQKLKGKKVMKVDTTKRICNNSSVIKDKISLIQQHSQVHFWVYLTLRYPSVRKDIKII